MNPLAANEGVPADILSRTSAHWLPTPHASVPRILFDPGLCRTKPSLQVQREGMGRRSEERTSGGIR